MSHVSLQWSCLKMKHCHIFKVIQAKNTDLHCTLMSASHSWVQILILSSRRFFCPDATNTCVWIVRIPFPRARTSRIEKMRSIPMLTPTHGTTLLFGSNMPTSSSYRPPPATDPTADMSPTCWLSEEPKDKGEEERKGRKRRERREGGRRGGREWRGKEGNDKQSYSSTRGLST